MPETSSAGDTGASKPRRRAAAKGAPALKLPSELGIEQAAGLRSQLAGHIGNAKAVVFDAADIERIHTAAMQLFCLFCSDRRAAGRETSWLRPSPALRSAAALLGVTTLLQIAREQA